MYLAPKPAGRTSFRAHYYAVYRFLNRCDATIVQDRDRRYYLWEGGRDLHLLTLEEIGRLLLSGTILPLSDPQPLPGPFVHMRPIYNPARRGFEFRTL
ncbi:MAG TPA: hypothetical protein VIK92_01865 [Thermaerobacter sp.]